MRTHRSLGSVVGLIVIALTGSLFVAAPAHAGATSTSIDLLGEYTTKKAIYHDNTGPNLNGADRISVAGVLSSGGEAVAAKTVVLQQWLPGSETWKDVGSSTTNAGGGVQVIVDAKRTATFRLFFDGSADPTYASAYSPEHTVKVMRDLNAKVVEKPSKLVFKGKVSPKWARKKIVLERKTSKKGKWQVVNRARTSARSTWSFRVGAPRTGSWWYRAWVPGRAGYIKSYSAVLRTYTY